MFAKLLDFWHRKTGPPPDQMSLAVAALLLVEASRYRFKTIHAEANR
jgi:hypothetical protein